MLIVDDHEIVVEGLRQVLGLHGDIDVVATAMDGRDALEKARMTRPDVILLDAKIPGMDGIEVTRTIAGEDPHARVVILSAFGDNALVLRAIEAGAAGYLLKDIAGGELVRAIRWVFEGKSVLDPSLTGSVLKETKALLTAKKRATGFRLTQVEEKVLELVAKGMSNKEIALELHLSQSRIKQVLCAIYKKLDVKRRAEAVVKVYGDKFGGL